MKSDRTIEKLIDVASKLEIIDAHEHLPREEVRTGRSVDVFTLFSHYTHADLITAGMSEEDFGRIQDTSVPLEERWVLFGPFYRFIRFGSYARAAHIALRKFYGFDEVNSTNYKDISAAMAQANTPGIYDRVLRQACGIKTVLHICSPVDVWTDDMFTPVMRQPTWQPLSEFRQTLASALGSAPTDLTGHLEGIDALIATRQAQGVVGLKMSCQPVSEPTLAEADKAYKRAGQSGYVNLDEETRQTVEHYIIHHVLDLAGSRNLTVAVHTGMFWNNWGDFTRSHPKYMVPILMRHRNTRFDLYHAGIPWTRLLGNIVKNFPNAFANLCWCHIISPQMTVRTLDEWLDLVPVNKIIGFGGDYSNVVEKVYGHLIMCRENLARVLAGRIERGLMSFDEAEWLLGCFLVDNPTRLYRLGVG